ncbi:MAG TPA: HAD family hydrolase [Xanthomonadaceae bacterium]|nr:HAD family hydrolase [Xanthomonadaceae bacterium]
MPTPLAITLDLDDTLWPIAPVMQRAEAALDAWMREHAPAAAQRWPVAQMRALRERIARQHPQLAHDYSQQRRLTLAQAFADCGVDAAQVDPAFEAFYSARNTVDCYPEAIPALQRIAGLLPVAALTNGNADLDRIGLSAHFRFALSAHEHGRGKPSACLFHAACERLGIAPQYVLHVGDDTELDIVGAHEAGLRTCWINRDGRGWPRGDIEPDLEFAHLGGLADWLAARMRVTASERTAA